MKSPGGIRPHRYSPSPRGAKYVMVTQDTSPRGKAEVCDDDLFGRANTGGLGQVTMKNKKSPRGIIPHCCSPSPRGVKHIKVTQDTFPSPGSERHGEYLFRRAKTGSLGQVTTKKIQKKQREKNGYY